METVETVNLLRIRVRKVRFFVSAPYPPELKRFEGGLQNRISEFDSRRVVQGAWANGYATNLQNS